MGLPSFPKPLVLALLVRSLALLLPQTLFQPDEYWQSLEPAHRHVFGYGYLTWEWRDLPDDGGRMRGWLWPSIFVLVYKLLQRTGLDQTGLLTLAPRMVGVVVAAITDWATYRLSTKLMGPGSSAGAFFLSITNTFHAYALPRTLSNSPETMLTTLALSYFPFESSTVKVRDPLMVRSPIKPDSPVNTRQISDKPSMIKDGDEKLDYITMDIAGPHSVHQLRVPNSLTAAVFFASIAICIRPTTITFWGYLGLEYIVRTARARTVSRLVTDLLKAGLTGLSVLACSTYLDYFMTGKLYFPLLSFANFNLKQSGFFGATSPFYHLVQSLPILLFPLWYWWGQGFIACLLPARWIPRTLTPLYRPSGMRSLARALTFAIFTLSFSPHSEWRFLHPFLPSLLLFALPPLFHGYTPTIMGAYRFTDALRQYTRIPKRAYYFLLVVPILVCSYACIWHDWAGIEAMNVLRRGDVGEVTSLGVAMNCHSTPWMSHLHRDIPTWMVTCEPPLGDAVDHVTYSSDSRKFFAAPLPQFKQRMLDFTTQHEMVDAGPSHVLTFGAILDMGETEDSIEGPTIKDALVEMGYREVWHGRQPFDSIARESTKRGGVRIWTKVPAST